MQKSEITPANTLERLVDIQSNSHCLYCGQYSKQWVQLEHAIFLCLDCAADFREYAWATKVKSANLDPWTLQEVQRLEKGGNQRFASYLKHYEIGKAQIRVICACKASAYYRDMLDGRAQGEQPTIEQGRKIAIENMPFYEMKAAELLQSAKEKALWLGHKTKELGQMGYTKIQEGAQTVTEKTKEMWAKAKGQEDSK